MKFKKLVRGIKNTFNLDFQKLRMRCNTLENENEVLKNTIKDELYKEFMAKLSEPTEIKRIKTENKKLRQKVKMLKEEIKNG